jgi:hypothetical protein
VFRKAGPAQGGKPQPWTIGWGIRKTLGAPIACIGVEQIADNGRLIRELAHTVRTGPGADPMVWVQPDRTLDVAVMAWEAQVPMSEIERLLDNRRRQSRQATWGYLAGGSVFVVLGFIHAASLLPALPTLLYALSIAAICCCFFLLAFYNALINWQVRTRRLGTAREFLDTDETWRPS